MKYSRMLARALVPLLVLLSCAIAHAGQIVLLIRIGTDSEGNPLFRQADSSDTSAAPLSNIIQSSSAIQEASRYYDAVQQDKLAQSLTASGTPASQLASAIAATPTQPTFIEVQSGSGGSYNDWTGKFSIQAADGTVTSYTQPRVVFPMGGQVMTSGDTGLIEQTLIHEMGHGAMCQCYICQALRGLPNSANLGKAHSGGSVTDPQLAFIEGWAEFVGAYFTGRTTIAQDPDGAIDSNWYASDGGTMKTAQQLLSCEGWAATVMYKISVAAKDDNAMWKLTQAMSRQSPQSLTDLLTEVAQADPELAPIIDQQLNQLSNGEIPNLAAMQQDAGEGPQPIVTQQGTSGAASNVNPNPTVNTQAQSDIAALQARYASDQAQLNQLPWWNFWTRWSLNSDLSSIQDAYAQEEAALTSNAAAPESTSSYETASYVAPAAAPVTSAAGAAPAAPQSYSSVIDAIRSGDSTRVRQALDAHRREMDRRNALRATGTN